MIRAIFRLFNFWSYIIMIFIILFLFVVDIKRIGLVDWAMNGEDEEYVKSIQDRVRVIYPEKIGLVFSIILWITFINQML